jgi:hypothetical protein
MEVIPPIFKGDFFGLDLQVIFFWGMGTILRGYLLGGMGGRSLVVFQTGKVGVFFFSSFFKRNYSFSAVRWGWLEKGVNIFFLLLFFFKINIKN